MSVFGQHHINRHSVEPLERTADEYRRTVYPGELVWMITPVRGGKVACRLISIDLENKTCELEITATKDSVYPKGSREFHVPFTRVFKRTVTKYDWFKPRFSIQWVDYPTAKERAGEQWQRLVKLVKDQ